MRPDTLGVVGLGAVGGSLAWQASLAGVPRVVGFSPRPAEGVAAVRAGAVTDLAPSIRFLCERADVVILATPPAATFQLLPRVARDLRAGALCTDVLLVKGRVAAAAGAAGLAGRFAGSHPAVSFARSGFAGAEPAAFRRALVYVTPVGTDDIAAREIADCWSSVFEADPVVLDPDDHDAVVAWTRHLPFVATALVARACAVHGPRGVTYGQEARDVTRGAMVPVDVARDVLLLNREAILAALDDLEETLGSFQQALRAGNTAALETWLTEASTWRRRLEP